MVNLLSITGPKSAVSVFDHIYVLGFATPVNRY